MGPPGWGTSPRADPRFRSGPPAHVATTPPPLPPVIEQRLGGALWEQVWIKQGTEVWRASAGEAVTYLKIGPGPEILAERDRLAWLDERQHTPRLVEHHTEQDAGWLLTAAVPGVPAHDPRFRMGSVQPWLEALGRALRRFHDELAVDGCPFDAQLDRLLAAAERRVAAGGVDPATLGSSYQRHSAEQLLGHLIAMRPEEPADDLVVAHGDPTLPNFLLTPAGDRVSGLVDVGRVGVSDRYRDIAIIVRSLGQNIGPELAYVLLEAYGMPHPDLQRLEFYVLLDEMW